MARGTSLNQLVFVGCVGMLDPPRPGAAEAIEAVRLLLAEIFSAASTAAVIQLRILSSTNNNDLPRASLRLVAMY